MELGLSLRAFLEWERAQDERYEFDGIQPIPMSGATGETLGHQRMVRRILRLLEDTLPAALEPFPGDLRVVTPTGQVRYPDVIVTKAGQPGDLDAADPILVVEILSPSTRLTDLHIKPRDYASVSQLVAYVVLEPGSPEGALIFRRAADWSAEALTDTLAVPEIAVSIPLGALYLS